MSDFQQQYALWDEFLAAWPLTRLATMTLDKYSKAGANDSFTYWIESRLDEMGSIWGGSSFKFGVFSRKDTEDKKSDAKLSYSDTHGWYSSLGTTAEEAFEKVRGYVVQVAKLAAQGDVDGIEAFEHLGEVFKWKIAFHYQDRQTPVIVDVFKRAPLALYVSGTASQSMAALQKATLAKRPAGLGILEFGYQVWKAWSQKKLAIWKLSHGLSDFSADERQHYLQAELGVMHGDTGKGQGDDFKKVSVGTLFFLCHGNENLVLVGQFTADPEPCANKGDDWLQRRYRVLRSAIRKGGYQGAKKGWTPNYRSTFKLVGAHDLPDFESNLLKPYFGADLAELAALAGEPLEATSLGSGDVLPPVPTTATLAVTISKPVATCDNRIYYGPPGTGKTYTLMRLLEAKYGKPRSGQHDSGDAKRYSFVTFHQSYGYEEFVEGLRPVLAGEAEAGEVAYEIRPGVFKELCRKARQAPDQRFAMVIDEINRGNISKIFGELITLVEADKRDPLNGKTPPIEVTLAYSGDKFSVPANLDIIGTMNTADRSLALLDTALRRRFEFVPLMPDTRDQKDPADQSIAPLAELVVTTEAGVIDVRLLLQRMNERIEALYDRDHCIGHAYLTGLAKVVDGPDRFEALAATFRHRILPLLEEYFFEDWRKIRLVLADNQKADPAIQFIRERVHEQDLAGLFGPDHGLDTYATRRRYEPQASAFVLPSAYIAIYQAPV
ncbi:MAG: AAA family ATPase [Chromatiaceae bacterium]|nr:AAA family ATPase [Chromatiaceae bacterium]MBP6807622.1 AAA family ATPase [Chromatiaceae bacterium]MBP8289616.1 AAA family ATPase [Chromatiaceae bacterium]